MLQEVVCYISEKQKKKEKIEKKQKEIHSEKRKIVQKKREAKSYIKWRNSEGLVYSLCTGSLSSLVPVYIELC